jgi:hypothetical protein
MLIYAVFGGVVLNVGSAFGPPSTTPPQKLLFFLFFAAMAFCAFVESNLSAL